MAIDLARRRLLLQLTAFAVACSPAVAGSASPRPTLLGAWRREGRDYAGLWSAEAGARGVELPFRAHQVLAVPGQSGHAIAVGRRPGEFVARIDLRSMELVTLCAIDPEFNTNGHAVYIDDGATLAVSENDVMTGAGAIAHYDAQTLECYRRDPTLGVGPHALLREPEGTLLIANGGVLTLPQTGRTKLNPGQIDASVVRLDAAGRPLGQWRLLDSNLSIRHLARASNGIVGIALQAEHSDAEQRALAPVFALFDGSSLRCAELPPSGLGGYGGDVACVETSSGPLFAVGCTRAGAVAVWDATGRIRAVYPLRDACAVVVLDDTLVSPSEHGEIGALAGGPAVRWDIGRGLPAWDNHAAAWLT